MQTAADEITQIIYVVVCYNVNKTIKLFLCDCVYKAVIYVGMKNSFRYMYAKN